MSHRPTRPVENYTNAFLTTLGVFLFMVFWVIAAVMGYAWVVVTAFGLDQLFRWIGRVRAE